MDARPVPITKLYPLYLQRVKSSKDRIGEQEAKTEMVMK